MAGELKPPYVAMACFGNCKVCGRYQDLRCGACFACADRVAGKVLTTGADGTVVHRLWSVDNPDIVWHVQAPAITDNRCARPTAEQP